MKKKGRFLSLFIFLALTFPGMSVCAAEQQTDNTDSEESAISQEVIDYFNSNEIYYYNLNSEAKIKDSNELIAEMAKEILIQKQEIADMEVLVQVEKAQVLAMQERVTNMGIALFILATMLAIIVAYNIRLWLTHHDHKMEDDRTDGSGSTKIKVIDFRQH